MANWDATEFGAGAVMTTNADATGFGDAGTVRHAGNELAERIPDVLLVAGAGSPGGGAEVDAGSWSWLT